MTRCRPTKLTFNMLFFCRFLSSALAFVVKFCTFIARRCAIHSTDPTCADFSLLVRMSMTAARAVFFAEILVFFLIFILNKNTTAVGPRRPTMSAVIVGRQNDSRHSAPTKMTANIVGRQCRQSVSADNVGSCVAGLTMFSRSHRSLTLNMSQTATDTAIVTMEGK